MLFRQLFDKTSCTYTYLLASASGRKAFFIDPVLEQISLYQRLLQELELTLVTCLETHLHADHITASGLLRKQYQSEIMMGDPCAAKHVTHVLKDNEIFSVDGIKIRCLYTPGHTDDSYCYLMNDRVFTGDTLLIRSTGRTDFQNGNSIKAYHSIFDKLLALKDQTLVYPGHDYKGETVSTIAEEKHFNPRLQVNNAQEYADMMSRLNLEPPQKMDIAIPANLLCGLSHSL